MVGIFRTNISTQLDKNSVIEAIYTNFNVSTCSIDMEDCDKVLRIVAQQAPIEEKLVISFLQQMGYQCDILD
ncbi:hypothetical protein [Chitinophaga tropicalis]|uniref:Uncharacterized protein n=1 Tax=Chitinophaga tropicalis TaxID=2683588 RepID=A0A7K1U8T0_9BACT|nr:hypothetical protein [Chitinophaga tropicalis]MVT10405.1 hypothetical protein [Chitinophaga tropicalis]